MDFVAILIQYFKSALFAGVFTSALILLALKFFPKLGLMDRPEKYGLNRAPVPYYGGLAIFLAFIVSVLIFVTLSKAVIGLLTGATIIAVLGFLDDLFCIKPWIRLVVQFLAALVLVVSGVGILSINMPFFGVISFSSQMWNGIMIFSAAFTILWVMTILNTMNFVDGVSGLTSGVSFVACMAMFFLSIHPGIHDRPESQIGVAMIALILAMISLVFLFFDFPKARILMGDTGSTLLGFLIATLAIFSGGKVATAFLVLGIPILDMAWVVLRRLFSCGKFWRGDRGHLHHRLLTLGLTERVVVLIYLSVTAIFGFSAVVLVSGQQKFFMIIALTILMILLAGALVFIPKKK